jgi:hypothetical protein
MQDPPSLSSATHLDLPYALATGLQSGYAPDVVWAAPRREVIWVGREQVVHKLLQEAAAMQGLQFTRLRQNACDSRVIDEFVARFTYAGTGIDRLDAPAGARMELQRLRILTLADGLVKLETAIETWTALDRG